VGASDLAAQRAAAVRVSQRACSSRSGAARPPRWRKRMAYRLLESTKSQRRRLLHATSDQEPTRFEICSRRADRDSAERRSTWSARSRPPVDRREARNSRRWISHPYLGRMQRSSGLACWPMRSTSTQHARSAPGPERGHDEQGLIAGNAPALYATRPVHVLDAVPVRNKGALMARRRRHGDKVPIQRDSQERVESLGRRFVPAVVKRHRRGPTIETRGAGYGSTRTRPPLRPRLRTRADDP